MSEIEKLKEAINKLKTENLLLRLFSIVIMMSFATFITYMIYAKEFDFKAAVLELMLIIQILVVELFIYANT
jgi:hypothetical protein